MDRVCPHCGEPPGVGVFCAACGRNLSGVEQLPTRAAWEAEHAAPVTATADALGAFLATMRAAGNPGVVRVQRARPGFLGRARHAEGWVLRPVRRDAPTDDYERGRFLTVDGRLHVLTSATRGYGARAISFFDLVGEDVVDPRDEPGLAAELDAVLAATGQRTT